MDDYMELLKKAKKQLPDINKAESRLEIPRILSAYSGRRTLIKNFSDIVNVTRRDAKHLAKFLFKELAVPGSINGNELMLQAKISDDMINQRITEYVKEFVKCHECGKYDTVIVREGGIDFLKCEACGAKKTIKRV